MKMRKEKNEKRRVLLWKKSVKREHNMTTYGAGSGAAVVVGKTVEFNRRLLAAFLALVFVLTSVVVGLNIVGKADEEKYNMYQSTDDSGLVLRKGLKKDADGTYSIRMEAYATKPIATKTVKANTPLDIVLVMDQSASMDTKDVLTEGYYIARNPSFTINDIESGNYYYYDKDDDKYYPVEVDNTSEASYVKIRNSNGDEIKSWTAQSANNWYNSNPNKDNQKLYYTKNEENPVYETVCTSSEEWYKNAGVVKVDDLLDAGLFSWDSYFWTYNNKAISAKYYYNSSEDTNRYYPSWHRVYGNTHGVAFGGYYVYLWYYKKAGNNLSYNCDADDYNQAVSDGYVARVPNSSPYTNRTYGNHDAWESSGTIYSDRDYKGGKLYIKKDADSVLNKLYTSEETLLAWPLSQDDSNSNKNPGSSTYHGNLYAAGYRLYYMKDGETEPTYIADAVNNKTDEAYPASANSTNPLYDHYSTRLDEMKTAAGKLVSQIAETATEDSDYRIAVVGFTDNGSVKTGNSDASALVSLTNGDTDSDTNKVNDTVDSAINGLTAESSNASKLAKGLETANSIFGADEENDGSRKRVVIVFTDAQPNEEGVNDRNDAKAQGAVTKDAYNASLFTVGICITDDDAKDFLNKLSSNYFTSTKTGNPETKTEDGIQYYYNDSARATLNTDAEAIATLVSFENESTSLNTSVALDDNNSILKDIITSNFIVDNAKIGVAIADGSMAEDGTVTLTNEKSDPENISADPIENNTITVRGFDYSANYIDKDKDGKAIVVTVTGLKLSPKVDPDSDKRIYSNAANSGIYKTGVGTEETLMGTFPRPFLDAETNLVPKGTSGITKDGIVLNKYLTANENGNYDLTLEAYSTLKNEKVTTTEKIPTDFVVVVDQSASMKEADMPTGKATQHDNVNLETVADGAYYYYDAATDNYYKVYGVKDYLYRYYPANSWFTGDIVSYLGADIGWFMKEDKISEKNLDNAFYFREYVNGETYYLPIKTTIEGKIGTYYMRFSFQSKKNGSDYDFNREETTYSSNGKSPWYKNVVNGNVMNSGTLWAAANAAVQTIYPDDWAYTFSELNLGLIHPRTGMYINYPMYVRHLAYTKLCYRDVNGVEHELPSNQNKGQTTWEYCNDNGQALTTNAGPTRPTYSNLYTFGSTISRIDALQAALTDFAKAVAKEEDSYGAVKNKVSIIGFSSDENTYNNTELLTGDTFTIETGDKFPSSSNGYSADGYNHNGKTKSKATPADYAGALVKATNGTVGEVNGKITEAINAITAYGGTKPADGLDMAYQVLENREEKTYEIHSNGKIVPRNTVVIFFTDGQPGNYHYSNQYEEANKVVESAKKIKDNGTSIFSIGVFGESDGNPLTYADTTQNQADRAEWKYLGGWRETYQSGSTYYCLRRQWRPNGADGYTKTANDTIYDYMSVTSSNYPDAEEYIAPAWLNGSFNGNYIAATEDVRHKESAEATNKYYRMASSQATLVEAFLQAITMNNQPMESDGTLGPSTILRDVLNDGTFEMTGNTTYTVETAKGKADHNGVVTFEKERTAIALSPPPSLGANQIEVTGFDYATNSIYYGKDADEDNDLSENQGRKLIVTLTNVVPNKEITSDTSDSLLYSNNADASGLEKIRLLANFPTPAITRHSYTLDVGDENKKAQFEVTTTLVAGSDASDDLSDVILVAPDGTRTPYKALSDVTFTMGDTDTFYFENVPAGYSVKTSMKAPDRFYTYEFWENSDVANKKTMSTKTATESTLGYSDNVLHVTSESSQRTVTIAESVSGPYANESDVFDVELILKPPVNSEYDEDTITLANDVVLKKKLNGNFEATVDGLPGDQNEKVLSVPAGWTLVVKPVEHDRYVVDTGYPKYNEEYKNPQVNYPDEGMVIQNEMTHIYINNVSKDIPVEGVFDSNHHILAYILSGVGALALAAGGYYVWKKKDEFVEE